MTYISDFHTVMRKTEKHPFMHQYAKMENEREGERNTNCEKYEFYGDEASHTHTRRNVIEKRHTQKFVYQKTKECKRMR